MNSNSKDVSSSKLASSAACSFVIENSTGFVGIGWISSITYIDFISVKVYLKLASFL